MNILYYDCFAGISGDMNLAAMIDLGVAPEYLRAELDKLHLQNEFTLSITRDSRNGIHGTRVDVLLTHRAHERSHPHAHSHDHTGHHPCADSATHGAHRNFADIRKIITDSTLPDTVKETSLRIFRNLAEAEAKVHGQPVDTVHFHEVGATDAIVDIVGAAICRYRLGVDAVWASPVELGKGFVHCAHGLIPVPAPATVEILHGIPTVRGGTDHEATTPTGAAILATLVDTFTETPSMRTAHTGYGIGHRQTGHPNILRVHLATANQQDHTPTARLLQCNIDDMTGESLGHVMDVLMEHGAMDVHFTPIVMKKSRPATMLSLLCGADEEERFRELLFRHTTTLGIKCFTVGKTVLERQMDTLETALGTVRMKRALLNGEILRSKPEFEDCREIARRSGLPLSDVYALVGKLA